MLHDSLSPVRRLEREAMVGSLADAGPADGRSNLNRIQANPLHTLNSSRGRK